MAVNFVALPALADDDEWMVNYEDALKKSEKTGLPILANFTGSDWCGYCIKMHEEVFKKKRFKKWAKENVILLELDYPRSKTQDSKIKKQNQELLVKYKITGYPSLYFLNSEGEPLSPRRAYIEGGPSAFIEIAESYIEDYLESTEDIRDAAKRARSSPNAAQAFRTWTNTDGKKINARMVSKGDEEVTIQLKNGRLFTLPLNKFSKEDQAFVKAN